MAQHACKVAIGREELERRLFPHAGDARDVVRRVAHEPLEVLHAFGGQPVALQQELGRILLRIRQTAPGQQHVRALAHQLQRVPVARDQQRGRALRLRRARERAQDVVRLVAGALAHGHAHLPQELPDQRELAQQILRRLAPAGLVGGVAPVAERRLVHVERHGQVVRLRLRKLEQHGQKPVQRAGGHAVARGHIRQRVIGAVEQAVAVDGDQSFHGFSFPAGRPAQRCCSRPPASSRRKMRAARPRRRSSASSAVPGGGSSPSSTTAGTFSCAQRRRISSTAARCAPSG